MPFQIIRQDITQMHVDAIVNAANNSLLGGGGVDGAIHRAAGPGLLAECRTLGGCETGDAKVTNGYSLYARWVIHTVGPVWMGGRSNEAELLASCYRRSLERAIEKSCDTVAFPLISAGAYGYPKDEALRIAEETITAFLNEPDHDMLVFLVVFDKDTMTVSEERFAEIRSFIDDRYVQEHSSARTSGHNLFFGAAASFIAPPAAAAAVQQQQKHKEKSMAEMAVPTSLARALDQIDESFTEMLLRKIDERGMTDAQCYKKANIDRKLFSKIRSDKHYHPKKSTVIAFALALELDLDETRDMLMKAGFALSHSSQFDIIVEYFISKKIYDIMEINNTLFAFDQMLIGGYDK
jgi:O-acetyl-ADP-ribose deacetylase (regulator of RNase III)